MTEILYIIAGSLLTLGAAPVARRFGAKARDRQEKQARLRILRYLLDGGARLDWIADQSGLDLDRVDVSLHLERMVEEGLLRRSKGEPPNYSLTTEGRQVALWGER
jgi:DNA-binding MarR family transcriptional regulator